MSPPRPAGPSEPARRGARTLDRRSLLVAGGGLAAASCTASGSAQPRPTGRPSTPSPTAGSPPSSPPPSASPSPEPLARSRWRPPAGDVHPEAKKLAADFVVALASYSRVDATEQAAAERVRRAAAAVGPTTMLDVAESVPGAMELLREGVSAGGDVVYAEIAGLVPADPADHLQVAVIVVLRRELTTVDGRTFTRTRAINVRLRRASTAAPLGVRQLGSAGGTPVGRPRDLPAQAAAVLDDQRIDLPDSARWDVHRGVVDLRLLRLMTGLADLAPYRVVVFQSGHPYYVVGTRRVSNHTVGRAVDIWSVAGTPVVAQRGRADSPAHRLVRAAAADPGPAEIGSPWDDDGPGSRRLFTNGVHQDHIHIGFGYRREK